MNSNEDKNEQQVADVQDSSPANEIKQEADKENLEVNKQPSQEAGSASTGKKKNKKDKKKKQEQANGEETKEPEKVKQDNLQITKEQLASEGIEGEILRPDEHVENEDEFGYNEDEYKGIERVDIPKHEKDLGGKAFAAGKYEEATKHYSKAILGTNFLFKDGLVETEEKARELLTEVQIPCYLNNALCFIKLENWRLAYENAHAATQLDEENAKALYRKGLAAFHLGDLTATAECVKKALELQPNDSSIRALALDLKEKRKQIYEKEKKMGQKIVQELTDKIEKESVKKPEVQEVEFLGSKNLGKLKKKLVEPIVTKQQNIVHQVETWKDQLKLLILLPLNLLSETCCRRRLPSQFYQVKNSKKGKEN